MTTILRQIIQILSKYRVVKGGNAIIYQLEDEIDSSFTDPIKQTPYYPNIEYIKNLERLARENGIDIPIKVLLFDLKGSMFMNH